MLHKSTTTTTTTTTTTSSSPTTASGNRRILNEANAADDREMPVTNQWEAAPQTRGNQDFEGQLDISAQLARALDESLVSSSASPVSISNVDELNSLAKIIDIQRRKTKTLKRQDANNNNENENFTVKPSIRQQQPEEEEAEEPEFRANKQPSTSSSSSTFGGPQQHQHQYQPHQQQQQQASSSQPGKQQSGETLSSFESDYDLLVYLGETETEDIVDTERSLDYQDQTWRQSICGGASLAPTIDESLSELLSATSVTPASLGNSNNQNLFGPSPSGRRDHNNQTRTQQYLADDLLQQTPTFGNQLRTPKSTTTTTTTTNYHSSLPRQVTNTTSDRRLQELQQQQQQATRHRPTASYYATLGRDETSARARIGVGLGAGATSQLPRSAANLRRLEVDECDDEVSLAFNQRQKTSQTTRQGGKQQQQQALAAAGVNEPPPSQAVRPIQQVDERHLASGHQPLHTQGQGSLAGNLSKKVVSLFNRKQQQSPAQPLQQTSTHPHQHQVGVDGASANHWPATGHQSYNLAQPGREQHQAMTTRQRQQQQQQQAAGQSNEAAELDRLLAEMSQSLDLDSLARYDPFRGRSAPVSSGHQPVNANPNNQTTMTTTTTRQQPTNRQPNTSTSINSRGDSILDDYEGASRMLEQMISDELGESLTNIKSTPRSRASPASKSLSSNTNSASMSSTSRLPLASQKPASAVNLTRQATAASEPDYSMDSSASGRKVSTCSSSQATDLSVIPNYHRAGTQQQPPEDKSGAAKAPSEVFYENRSVWRYRGNLPLSKTSSVEQTQNSQQSAVKLVGPQTATSAGQLNPNSTSLTDRGLPTAKAPAATTTTKSPPIKWSHSLDIVEKPKLSSTAPTEARRGSSSPPPPPPAVDYNDDKGEDDDGDQNVIRVEAAELALSSSDSELDEIERRRRVAAAGNDNKSKVDRMKRRTLSSMRSVRNKLSNLMTSGHPNEANQSRQAPSSDYLDDYNHKRSQPKPPKRSSSIGSSHSITNGHHQQTKQAQITDDSVVVLPETSLVGRPSRGRERQRPTGQQQMGAKDEAGHKSFGQQLRERLSRSKSRFSQFLRPSSSRRRAQSTPDEQRHKQLDIQHEAAAPPEHNNHNLLFQPSDIARNTTTTSSHSSHPHEGKLDRDYDSSLDRHLKADLNKVKSATSESDKQATSARKKSTSSSSSNELSGLDTTTPKVAPKRAARSRQAKAKNNAETRRSSSLISIKRLSGSFKQKLGQQQPTDPMEDVDSMKLTSGEQSSPLLAGAVARAKRKRRQRRNKSAGDHANDDDDDDDDDDRDDNGPLRPRRRRSKSPPDAIIKPKLATTDDYFGLVAPAKASPDSDGGQGSGTSKKTSQPVHLRVEMGPEVKRAAASSSTSSDDDDDENQERPQGKGDRLRKLPDRSQSLRSMGNQRRSPVQSNKVSTITDKDKDMSSSSTGQVKAVSFSNLTNAINQRRPLPATTNSFRPTSALAKFEPTQPSEVSPEPPTTTTTTTLGPDGRVVTPIRPHNSPLPTEQVTVASGQQLAVPQTSRAATKSPMRDRGAALMDDFRAKCGKLASKLSIPTRHAPTPPPAPTRPPRSRRREAEDTHRRSKSLAAPSTGLASPFDSDDEDEDEEPRLLDVQASSPPPLSLDSELDATRTGPTKPEDSNKSSKLSSLARRLNETSREFFHPTKLDQSTSSPSTGTPPGKLADTRGTPRTSQRQPLRSLDEPTGADDLCQWRPVIASSRPPARASSFRLIRKDDTHPSGTVNRTDLGLHHSVDTDSTWESGSGDDNDDDDDDEGDGDEKHKRKDEADIVRQPEQQVVVADGTPDKSDSNVAPQQAERKRKLLATTTTTTTTATASAFAGEMSQWRPPRQLTGRDNFNSNNTSLLPPVERRRQQPARQPGDINPIGQYGDAASTAAAAAASLSLTADERRPDQNNNNINADDDESRRLKTTSTATTKQQVDASGEPKLAVSRAQLECGQHHLPAMTSTSAAAQQRQAIGEPERTTTTTTSANQMQLNRLNHIKHSHGQIGQPQPQPQAQARTNYHPEYDGTGQAQELNIDKKEEKKTESETTTDSNKLAGKATVGKRDNNNANNKGHPRRVGGQVEEICKTPFKFNSNLPSPTQVLSLTSFSNDHSKKPDGETAKSSAEKDIDNANDNEKAEKARFRSHEIGQQQTRKAIKFVETTETIQKSPPLELAQSRTQPAMISENKFGPRQLAGRTMKHHNKEPMMDQADANFLKATSHVRANRLNESKSPIQIKTDEEDDSQQNRLSIYENVVAESKPPEEHRKHLNDDHNDNDIDDDNDDWSIDKHSASNVPDPVRKLVEQFKNEARLLRSDVDREEQQAKIESDRSQQPKQEEQSVVNEEEEEVNHHHSQQQQHQPPERPRRKLVAMTSIINEPEDELMNITTSQQVSVESTAATVPSPKKDHQAADESRRRDSTFISEDPLAQVNDNSDSESSFVDAVASRRRLINKFERTPASTTTTRRPPDLPTGPRVVPSTSVAVGLIRQTDEPPPPTSSTNYETGSRRPAASRGPVGGSLVRRLAQTFDQQASTGSGQPSRGGRSPQVPPLRRTVASLDEEPKSDSTWYDAKSIELLDEAEVAELLRELDDDDDVGGGGDGHDSDRQVSTAGEEAFVSVGESTVSHGRRDQHPADGEDDDEATTLDDDTLNDDDEDEDAAGGGLDQDDDDNAGETSESVYASAAAAAVTPTSAADIVPSPPPQVAREEDNAKGNDNERGGLTASGRVQSRTARLSERQSESERAACERSSFDARGLPRTTSVALNYCPDSSEHHPNDDDNDVQKVNNYQHVPPPPATDPTDPIDDAQRLEQLNENKNSCQRQPTDTTNIHVDMTRQEHDNQQHQQPVIDQTFKNSLNHIISLRSPPTELAATCPASASAKVLDDDHDHSKPSGQQVEHMPASSSTSTCASSYVHLGPLPPLPAKTTGTCQLAKELTRYYKAILRHGRRATHKKGRRRSYKPLDESMATTTASGGGGGGDTSSPTSTTCLDANESTVTICNIKQTDEDNTNHNRRANSLSPHSSSASNSASTISSDEEDDEDGDRTGDESDGEDELDAKSIVKAAKKCSQLYEVFEQMLVIRAADEEKKQMRRQESQAKEDSTKEGDPAATGGDASYLDEDEDELSTLTEFRDDRSSLSSSSMSSISIPEMKQRQNLQKLYHIVQEIHSSEAKFVQTLRLLNVDFRNYISSVALKSSSSSSSSQHQSSQEKLMQQPPYDCVTLMLKHLPQLQALNENLLAELKTARDHWPKTQKVSHVLVKIGPFLKHYSSYIREFESYQTQFQDNLRRFPHFSQQVKEFEALEQCQKLTIQHHLLKPIQRIPQYRLLLQQYLHHLKPDDLDYEDTVNALEVVSRVAEHANQSLNEGVNFAKLLALQAKIVGKQRDIVQPGRLFIKEGELLKVCRKQIQPRWFVLLNDSLLYLTQIQSSDILYLNNEIPLDENCQVSIPQAADNDQSTEFNVCTSVRSFSLIAKSAEERDAWIRALRATIDDHNARRRTFSQATTTTTATGEEPPPAAPLAQPQDQLIGRKAPLWTPDSRVTTCQLCTSNFSTLFRRHHCRGCGRVVCSACSSNKAPLIYLKCRAARVCDQCFAHLKANIHLYYLPQSSRIVSAMHHGELNNNNSGSSNLELQHLDERELKRLDEYFRTLLKSQFVRHVGLDRLKESDLFTKKRLYLLLKK